MAPNGRQVSLETVRGHQGPYGPQAGRTRLVIPSGQSRFKSGLDQLAFIYGNNLIKCNYFIDFAHDIP